MELEKIKTPISDGRYILVSTMSRLEDGTGAGIFLDLIDTKFLKRKRRNLHKKTFDREFCYNLDVNLAKIIARALKAYEKTVVGVPNDLCYVVVDGELKKIRTMDEAIEYWHKLLKQMIWSFKEIGKGRPHEPSFSECRTPDDFRQKTDAYNKRVQRGIDLFAEYYQSLWI